MSEKICDLVKKEVRDDGTLFLDAHKTAILIRWLTKIEEISERYAILFSKFNDLIKESK